VTPYPDNDNLIDLQALQNGDDTALNRLIGRWQKPLFAFAWRYLHNSTDAHDLVAEVFVRLYQQNHRLAPDTRLSAWLFTILANLCHNHHRWRRRHPAVSLDASEQGDAADSAPLVNNLAHDAPTPDRTLEQNEALDALAQAIDRLPHDLKTTLLLHHYEHLGYREISQIAGCSQRGVETRLYRARQYLKAELTSFLRETVSP
jgi:RNA polymerase sigma-70 factor (ECF subfamily)